MHICVCDMQLWLYVCMHVWMAERIYTSLCMIACVCGWVCMWVFAYPHVCQHLFMYACDCMVWMYVYACMYGRGWNHCVCVYARMYWCVIVWVTPLVPENRGAWMCVYACVCVLVCVCVFVCA